ncbi:hypothetical protein GWI33_007349 [Rhynchophorus ferrugineus]|uniref:Secreted protein n=1 Tax=Rhynchophorus ferrugineus TaxID=354439 RepID=A0A834IDM8_RHYFE|nr:hypothetical protein GWI33_007349 [Rhynchophorus ferrugineus]
MITHLSNFFIYVISFYTVLNGNVNCLSCHQCSPKSENCAELTADTLNACFGLVLPNMSLVCYSAFLNYNGATSPGTGWNEGNKMDYNNSKTGIYRGCGIKPNTMNYCSWYNTSLDASNVSLVSCQSCDSDACNDHTFDDLPTSPPDSRHNSPKTNETTFEKP